VVTAPISAMTSHMSPRRHHFSWRMRHKTGNVPRFAAPETRSCCGGTRDQRTDRHARPRT
jgi:hypothetical protein